jgi:glucose-1-phosphate adenylyltransferase
MEPNIVILAGGVSSRMKKPGAAGLDARLVQDADMKSKAMIGLGEDGRPFLDYLLANVDAAGYTDVVIVVGEKDRAIREHYGSADRGNRHLGLSLSYAVQPVPPGRAKPSGTADALLRGLEATPEWSGAGFTVCNSDNLYSVGALRTLLESPEPCALIDYDRDALGFEPERVRQFAVLEKDGVFLRSIIEKPSAEEIMRATDPGGRVGVSMNVFRFSYDVILPYLMAVPFHPVRQEKEIPTAVMMLVRDLPGAVRVYPRSERVPDLTEKSDIRQVQDYLRTTAGRKGREPG